MPLDPDFVPFICALVTALCGKPCSGRGVGRLHATATGRTSAVWEWTAYGQPRTQFMAGEEGLADTSKRCCRGWSRSARTGRVLWCFADYAEELWDRPPCDPGGAKHERHLRPRPARRLAQATRRGHPALRRHPADDPTGDKMVTLDVTPDEYYRDPWHHAQRLYQEYLNAGDLSGVQK